MGILSANACNIPFYLEVMINMNIRPLTNEEQRFATKNHNLVMSFLNKKSLAESDFYDVVIFGYLRAVQEYCEKMKLRRYSFSTISWKRMRSALSNYYQYLARSKRNELPVRYHSVTDDENDLYLNEAIKEQDELMIKLEIELLLHELAAKLPRRTMNIIRMKLNREQMHDIAKAEHITFHDINRMLNDSRDIILKVCYESELAY